MRTRPLLAAARAAALAPKLDIDLNRGICHACLTFVSFALDGGNPHEITGALRKWTPDLWADGLAEYALEAVRRACDRGVPDAPAALADLELNGGRSRTARAIVRHLAAELSRRMRLEMRLEAAARRRLPIAPELN
jgi:hypothetical protein